MSLTDRGHDEARCPLWLTNDRDCDGSCRKRSYEETFFAERWWAQSLPGRGQRVIWGTGEVA